MELRREKAKSNAPEEKRRMKMRKRAQGPPS